MGYAKPCCVGFLRTEYEVVDEINALQDFLMLTKRDIRAGHAGMNEDGEQGAACTISQRGRAHARRRQPRYDGEREGLEPNTILRHGDMHVKRFTSASR
jgi:hypothetical protein